ncbi:MAG: hypothetical protein A2Z52_01195 [Candidatus Moranbacteria bacterium RBG_19FT_COMBO_42_6]|nr:MAG: hypothetical protein A2Z52_01195 [Candidatus Moranbacteria bacterium RBG_19FT_COMBO_42_6]
MCGEGGSCNSSFFESSTCFKGIYAVEAAQICFAESGGAVGAEGDTCVHNGANDKFSAGLFQINMIANGGMINTACAPKNIFNTYGIGSLQGAPLGGAKFDCEVKPSARALYSSCKTQLKDMMLNIQLACRLSGSGKNWSPWANSRKKCGF